MGPPQPVFSLANTHGSPRMRPPRVVVSIQLLEDDRDVLPDAKSE